MKRALTVIGLTVFIWSCTHKAAPTAATNAPAGNSGAAINNGAAKAAEVTPPANATTPSTPAGTRSPADANVTKSPEMMGQSTYNAKCGKCHGLKVTTDYTAERWVSIMQVMATKAHLDDTEKENVLAYVKANSKK
ncbi:MAG: hypothetical protein JST86_08475 [Bacteroidetes bacterium]|nr:hypothetical protein [Bacteroidota bacterium]